jgi:hypothetical protein
VIAVALLLLGTPPALGCQGRAREGWGEEGRIVWMLHHDASWFEWSADRRRPIAR